jgi:hypothetical protein
MCLLSYSIWYTCETVWDNAKLETVILMKTDTVLIGDCHINLYKESVLS